MEAGATRSADALAHRRHLKPASNPTDADEVAGAAIVPLAALLSDDHHELTDVAIDGRTFTDDIIAFDYEGRHWRLYGPTFPAYVVGREYPTPNVKSGLDYLMYHQIEERHGR